LQHGEPDSEIAAPQNVTGIAGEHTFDVSLHGECSFARAGRKDKRSRPRSAARSRVLL
jgi:hypothetical protein